MPDRDAPDPHQTNVILLKKQGFVVKLSPPGCDFVVTRTDITIIDAVRRRWTGTKNHGPHTFAT